MKKYIFIISVICTSLMMASCGSEDDVVVNFHDPANFFMPEENATDSTSILRRDFTKTYGSYLLFNDTLQHNYLGTDINGDDRYSTETLDITYHIGQSTSTTTTYTYTYLNTLELQKSSISFLKDYILTHITGKLKPFSWLLVNVINGKNSSNVAIRPYAVAGQRCIAISCNYLMIANRTESQKLNFSQRVLNILIGQLANNNADAFSSFYAVSSKYYSQLISSSAQSSDERTASLRAAGFIGSSSSLPTYYPSQNDDLNQYSNAVIQKTDEQLESQFGTYPTIMNKLKLVKEILINLGYVF